jgi:hypothetical protein
MLTLRGEPGAAERLVTQATVWLCDRYELGKLGLASHDASPGEEIEHLLGAPFESVELKRRRSSLIAAVLLDLCAVLGLKSLYGDVHNDIRAVNAFPVVMVPGAGPERYQREAPNHRWEYNPDYAERLVDAEPAAPHLSSTQPDVELAEAWRLLAVSSALRDRYFPDAISAFAEE